MAEPTIAPSERSAIFFACSGVEMPKADGAGNICVFPHEGDDGGEVGLDLAALARDTERRDDIEEALGLARDHRDAVLRTSVR